MARQNGPFGPSGTRAPPRRPSDDVFAGPPAHQNGQWPPSQPGQGFHFPPPEPDPNYPYHQPQDAQQWGQQPGPQGYDLGNYMPNGNQQQHYPAHDQAHYQQGQYPAEYGHADQGYAENDAGYGDYEEEEEPRRGRKWIFVAAALVGAIGLGGALAYTYKSVIAPNSGRVPLVKAGDANVKVRPENRKAARVNEDGAPPARPAAAPDSQEAPVEENGGPRRVRTIPIVPGAPPAAAETPSPQGVPGITLDMPRAPQAPPSPPPGRVVIGQPPPVASEPPPSPMVRRPPANPPVVATPQAEPPAVARPAPVPKAPAAPPPAKAKEASPPPAVVATTGAGYVAVLTSQKTRVGALSVFADLRQKYSDVLANKTPDVQEADLSARGLGTMYRLVVGPPGSRDAASGVCNQLKTAGYQGCWVTEY
jgi:hypothetical protein